MSIFNQVRNVLSALALLAFSLAAKADPGCNDAGIWGSKLVTDICWSCMLPIRILGVGGGSIDPPGANRNPVCACNDDLGVPSPGLAIGAWVPYRLFELVRNPYCMPVFGGTFLSRDFTELAGPGQRAASDDYQSSSRFHSHVYSFPLATMMELLTAKECNPGGYHDMDIMMMSEFDPIASDDLLAMFVYFETAMFANPLAIGACSIECGLLSANIPPQDKQMFWCAGCWGTLYPMSNNVSFMSTHNETSLIAARQLAVKHRRGMGHITYGPTNMCGGQLSPFLPKEQYRWQHLFPVPEAKRPCCHWTGASEYVTGGVSRHQPYSGEDVVHLLFRYTDCCAH